MKNLPYPLNFLLISPFSFSFSFLFFFSLTPLKRKTRNFFSFKPQKMKFLKRSQIYHAFFVVGQRWKWNLEWWQNSRRLLYKHYFVDFHITMKETLNPFFLHFPSCHFSSVLFINFSHLGFKKLLSFC